MPRIVGTAPAAHPNWIKIAGGVHLSIQMSPAWPVRPKDEKHKRMSVRCWDNKGPLYGGIPAIALRASHRAIDVPGSLLSRSLLAQRRSIREGPRIISHASFGKFESFFYEVHVKVRRIAAPATKCTGGMAIALLTSSRAVARGEQGNLS